MVNATDTNVYVHYISCICILHIALRRISGCTNHRSYLTHIPSHSWIKVEIFLTFLDVIKLEFVASVMITWGNVFNGPCLIGMFRAVCVFLKAFILVIFGQIYCNFLGSGQTEKAWFVHRKKLQRLKNALFRGQRWDEKNYH